MSEQTGRPEICQLTLKAGDFTKQQEMDRIPTSEDPSPTPTLDRKGNEADTGGVTDGGKDVYASLYR